MWGKAVSSTLPCPPPSDPQVHPLHPLKANVLTVFSGCSGILHRLRITHLTGAA